MSLSCLANKAWKGGGGGRVIVREAFFQMSENILSHTCNCCTVPLCLLVSLILDNGVPTIPSIANQLQQLQSVS